MVWFRVALVGLLGIFGMAAEGWHRPFTLLGPDQGLPSGAITSLAQDSDGFIWVGTESALLRYDGAHCRAWGREDGLPSSFIHRVLPADGGGVWVSTLRGLARFRAGRIERAQFDGQAESLPANVLELDREGRLWVLTSAGLFVQKEGLRFQRRSERPSGRAFTLGAGSGGVMHLGSEEGIETFLPDGSSRRWSPAQGLPADGVSAVAEDGAGRLWAGSGRNLAMKAPGGDRFTDQSSRLGGSLSPNSVPFRDADGSVWLPTQAGALHLAGEKTEQVDSGNGLPFRWVRTVFRDREGTLWVLGTALARLQGGGRVWNHSLASGTSGEVVWSIIRDSKGTLLAATDDGAIRVEAAGLSRIRGTEGHRIKGLTTDPTGTLWMVSTIGPTLWLRPGSQKTEVAPLGDFGFGVNSVMKDSRGALWLGHARYGILRWDAGARRLVQEVAPNTQGALGVFRIREDAQGRLWAATTAGLYLRSAQGSWRLFNEQDGLLPYGLYGMAFLPDGSAWVHYQEPQGLTRIRIDGSHLTVLEQRVKGQGLHSNLVYAVEVDERDRTWASTDLGLDRLDPPLHIGRREGMVSEDCAIQALLAEGGRIWVGTAAGLVRYEAGEADPLLAPPQAHILEMAFGPRRLEPPFDRLTPLPHQEATVTFRVGAPSYLGEGRARLQVRLLGLEDAWRDVEAPLVRYPALPGGRYRLETRASDGEGAFGPVAALDFQVRPPWWRTWWATGLATLAVLGLGRVVLRLRLAALARSKAELEALVAERTEELQHRNEELSSALGNVKQLSGLLPICSTCKKIRDDQGYWNQLEHYISEHSEVGFSHGICPDCVETMFPKRAKGGQAPEADPKG
ncbi:two-component regulator propeller domain-containing protein [Geothrix sp.]|jgi:ligand-binding sensor domain-containing protein|uniref:ligand-binding sensor domain-containing protein n=1 Tax=Geothrix sp. TaxID=1962974 RepID=UPI0025C2B5C2|nr:two-component regulator propeller domain-containing protein [Geothrix sp.]